MKIRDLMDDAFDETWFLFVTPDRKKHFFWNADYIGSHPDVMPELEPLLDRTFDKYTLEMRRDPEGRKKRVPVIVIKLDDVPSAGAYEEKCKKGVQNEDIRV